MAIHINGSDPNYLQYSFWMILQVISIHLRYLPLQTQILAGRNSDVCILTILKSCRTPTLHDGTKKHNSNPKPPHDQTSKIHKTKGMTASKISPTGPPGRYPRGFTSSLWRKLFLCGGLGKSGVPSWGMWAKSLTTWWFQSMWKIWAGRAGIMKPQVSVVWKFSKKYLKTITT